MERSSCISSHWQRVFDILFLGIKIVDDEKEKIVKAAYNCNPEIKIYQMNIDPKTFRQKKK